MTDTDSQNPLPDDSAAQDLASQLDDLLREVSEASAEDMPTPTPEPAADNLADAPASHAVETPAADAGEDTDGMAGDFATPEQTLAEKDDDLADQIQAMLDEAKGQAAEEAPQAEGATLAKADPMPAAEPPQPQAAGGVDPTIEQIDQMLAEDADDAADEMAGGFESFDQIMGTSSEEDSADAAPPDEGHDLAAEIDELCDDDFAAPDEVMEEAAAEEDMAGEFASADDVAAELDSQPELQHQAAVIPEAPAAVEADAHAETEEATKTPIDWYAKAEVLGEFTRRGCALVNKPMGKLPPSMRNTVGYVGLATLANASFLLIYGLLF